MLSKLCGVVAKSIGMIALIGASHAASAQVTFNVGFNEAAGALTPTERSNITSHVQEAGQTWMRVLNLSGPRSIDVVVATSVSAPTANGGSVTSSFVINQAGRDIFEQGMAGELRTGTDPNGSTADVNFTVGLNYLRNELWFDPNPAARTAPVDINRTDAMSVFIHEFGHAIAYNGWSDLATGQPPTTFWSVFDRWFIPGSPTLFNGTNSVTAWGSQPDLTINNIFHWGNSARRAPLAPPLVAPVEWIDGAPKPHVIEGLMSADMPLGASPNAINASLIDELMNGVVFFRGTRYRISSLDLGVLKDVGFTVQNLPLFANGFE